MTRFRVLSATGVVLTVLAWSACSIERHYELLSFFFDGVPNPRAIPTRSSGGDPLSMRQSATYTIHLPYQNAQCAECHGASFDMDKKSADVCLKCHTDQLTRYEVMHGPVQALACLWCHVPHESAYLSLLNGLPYDVCAQCHEPSLLNVERVPEHAIEDVSCLNCHSGHGGVDNLMLLDVTDTSSSEAPEKQG